MSAARAWAGVLLWGALFAPPVRGALEATMTSQMLAELPLLAVAGWLVGGAIPRRSQAAILRWSGGGIPCLVLATLAGMLWMLPRAMDASVHDAWLALAKLVSVPLLIGVPVALGWPHLGFVARGVFLLEGIATAFRLGWLYLASPVRLCSNYLLGDQQRLGRALVAIGVAACLVVAWKLVWGRIHVAHAEAPGLLG